MRNFKEKFRVVMGMKKVAQVKSSRLISYRKNREISLADEEYPFSGALNL